MNLATATPTEDWLILSYAVYGLVSVALTIWLARILFRNGAVFLESVFPDDPRMAEAVNRLLVVGFYLVNFGYACLLLTTYRGDSLMGVIEGFASKLGLLLLSLATMHFINLYVFHRIRRRARLVEMPPPVLPQMTLATEPAGR